MYSALNGLFCGECLFLLVVVVVVAAENQNNFLSKCSLFVIHCLYYKQDIYQTLQNYTREF